MPNLLAGEQIFPEFIQGAATPETMAEATLQLLRDESRRAEIKRRLAGILSELGGPGANHRAAKVIVNLIREPRAAG